MQHNRTLSLRVIILTVCSLISFDYLTAAGQVHHSSVRSNHPVAIAPASNLTFRLESYSSQALGTTRTYGVILPPNYAKTPHQQYPVIFLLHGGHGDATDWVKLNKGNALPVVQQLYANHRLPPSLIITPDGNDDRGSNPHTDPAYIDGPHGRVLTAIGEELVQVVKTRYRTKVQPQFWAVGGLSSGGWGAMNIGLHKLQYFRTLFSHSGYFTDKSGKDNSPINYVQQLSPVQRHSVGIYLDAGEGDGKYLRQSQQFHQTLDHLGIANTLHVFPGGHGVGGNSGWHYWHKHLEDSLSYVGDRFYQAEMTAKDSVH